MASHAPVGLEGCRVEEVGELAVGGCFGAASFGGVVFVGEFGLDGGQLVEGSRPG